MAIGSIKITELPHNNELNDNDLFLTSSALAGGDIYESKKLTFLNLWEKLKEKISGWTNAIINGDWTFKGKVNFNNKTTIDTGAIVDGEHSTSIINAEFLYNFITGGNYPENMIMPSYVGMIIHSTTLTTIAEVKARYGKKTNWLQLTGDYVIKPANAQHLAKPGSDAKDQGDNKVLLTLNNIPQYSYSLISKGNVSHNIKVIIHSHKSNVSFDFAYGNCHGGSDTPVVYGPGKKTPGITDKGHSHSAEVTSGSILENISLSKNEANNTVSNVDLHISAKYIFIWERIS